MVEETFVRGQEVYREGVDNVDKIYCIRNGEFELIKNLIKPTSQNHVNYLFKPIDQQKEENDDTKVQFSYKRFK